MFSPSVYSDIMNVASGFILSEIARLYGNNQSVVEYGRPFFERKDIKVDNSIGELPKDYRHLLSVGMAVNKSATGSCGCNGEDVTHLINRCNPDSVLYQKSEVGKKEFCRFSEVELLIVDEFYNRSGATYRPPSYKSAIALLVEKNTIKVCPSDVSHIEVMYLKDPPEFRVGYILNEDETWVIDTKSPHHIESTWNINIESKLVTAIATLYSIYSQDRELKTGLDEIKKLGLF